MFTSIINSASTASITLPQLLICTLSSIAAGLIIALCFMVKNRFSKSFVITIVMLPAIVQAVIMLVNGNIGTGVAVLGAFSLIRFRSFPGNSREIAVIFLAMSAGIATGMGQIWFALIISLVISGIMVLLSVLKFGEKSTGVSILKITIPEDMNYSHLFDDILEKYTSSFKLITAKTVSMGSLFELHYQIIQKDEYKSKEMIDELRCRNGNLSIVCGSQISTEEGIL